MQKIIQAVDKTVIRILELVLLLAIIAMVGLTFWQVIGRYVLKISTPYAEELSRLSLVWCIFMGAAVSVRFDEHIRVTVLLNRFPKVLRFIIQLLTYLAILFMAGVMIRYGIHHLGIAWKDHTTTLGYSRGWFYIPVPITGVLFAAYTIADIVRLFIGMFPGRKSQKEDEP